MNKVTAESRSRDSAVTLFGSGGYCALTKTPHMNRQPPVIEIIRFIAQQIE